MIIISRVARKYENSHYFHVIVQGINKEYIFRDRYVSQPITSKRYYVQCIKYIHINPVKAKMVNSLNDYKFSSYNYFLNQFLYNNFKDENLTYQDYWQICNNPFGIEDITFFDVDVEKKDKVIYNSISLFLNQNKLNLIEIFSNRKILKILVSYLKNGKNIKYKEISDFFEMGRGAMEHLKK